MNVEQIHTDEDLYEQALDLRYQLFFEEFGLPKEIVKDNLEATSTHLSISDEGNLVAYGRLTNLGAGHFKISQVVVLPSLQRQGYGKKLLQEIIIVAKGLGAKNIELNSQVNAKSLYQGIGFVESGEQYPSKTTGVPHVKMVFSWVT